MEAFGSYVNHLQQLALSGLNGVINNAFQTSVLAALDGQPSRELRRLVSASNLRSNGIYFTGSDLSDKITHLVSRTFSEKSIIYDPACGAGDLLIASASKLPTRGTLSDTLRQWTRQISGRDLFVEFTNAARIRLLLKAMTMSELEGSSCVIDWEQLFPLVQQGCGIQDEEAIRRATHIIANPPYCAIEAPEDCKWGSGLVNSAAVHVENYLKYAEAGTLVAAILPDVLRSGARYEKWRQLIGRYSRVLNIELCGLFDNLTDIHVFILLIEKLHAETTKLPLWPNQHRNLTSSATLVGDLYDVSVGPVVDYRDPENGKKLPFVATRATPPWKILRDTASRRRYSGRAITPPFVVVRRTSRVDDAHRAVGTIIALKEPVAVENHLLILQPKNKTLAACRRLLSNLQDPRTDDWLNHRIRCRHLTVGALRSLPVWS